MFKWGLFIFTLLSINACTRCDECDILVSEPTVPLQVFHQDSLQQINALLPELGLQIQELDSLMAASNASRLQLEDSVQTLSDLIAQDSTQYVAQLDLVSQTLAQLNAALTQDSVSLAALQQINDDYNTALDELTLGLTRIDTIYDLDTDSFIVNADSTEIYNLPLAPGLGEVRYLMVIGPDRFELTVTYSSELYQDEKSRVGYIARNIAVAHHSFDSLTVDCTENCISTDGKIMVYH